MGCWNETCGFSQQSIGMGDDVYAIIIVNNVAPSNSVYADGIATPSSFIIEAEYNDYGSIENPKLGFAVDSTLELFNSYLKEDKLKLSDEFFGDINGYKKDDPEGRFSEENGFESIESLFFAIERKYAILEQSGYGGTFEHSIDFMLMKKEVLESAWETLNSSDEYETKSDTIENFKDDILVMINTCFVDNSEKLKEINKSINDLNDLEESGKEDLDFKKLKTELYRQMIAMEGGLDRSWGGDNLKSKNSRWGNKVRVLADYNSVHTESFRKLFGISKDLHNKDNESDIIDVITKFLLTTSSFMLFRKIWYPQGHSSQHETFDSDIEYMERLLRKMYHIRKEKMDDGYYEDGIPETIGDISIFEEGKIICSS